MRGEQTLVEFLVSAQNVTKGLQAHQFNVHVEETLFDESPDYPAPLASLPEPDEENEG